MRGQRFPDVGCHLPRLGNRCSQWWGRSLLRALGWGFRGEMPNQQKMVIAVAPHTSNWDFFIGLMVVFALRLKISFFGKHSIFIPPFGRLLRRWGGIPIERSRAHGVVEQMSAALVASDQMLLALAPEGTRSRIEHWKTGFVRIAQQANVPILLIGLDYQAKQVVFGPLLSPNNDLNHIMDRVYAFFATIPAKHPDQFDFPSFPPKA